MLPVKGVPGQLADTPQQASVVESIGTKSILHGGIEFASREILRMRLGQRIISVFGIEARHVVR